MNFKIIICLTLGLLVTLPTQHSMAMQRKSARWSMLGITGVAAGAAWLVWHYWHAQAAFDQEVNQLREHKHVIGRHNEETDTYTVFFIDPRNAGPSPEAPDQAVERYDTGITWITFNQDGTVKLRFHMINDSVSHPKRSEWRLLRSQLNSAGRHAFWITETHPVYKELVKKFKTCWRNDGDTKTAWAQELINRLRTRWIID